MEVEAVKMEAKIKVTGYQKLRAEVEMKKIKPVSGSRSLNKFTAFTFHMVAA